MLFFIECSVVVVVRWLFVVIFFGSWGAKKMLSDYSCADIE
jgi:hypothetical protein